MLLILLEGDNRLADSIINYRKQLSLPLDNIARLLKVQDAAGLVLSASVEAAIATMEPADQKAFDEHQARPAFKKYVAEAVPLLA